MSKKRIIIIAVAVVVLLLGLLPLLLKKDGTMYQLTTVTPVKKDIINSVSATGTVEPVDQVEVGTQVSGVIEHIYVDFNSHVKKGDVIAVLDKSSLEAQVLQSKASLASSENELDYQTKNYNRIKKLFDTDMVSETDYESALYSFNNAKADVERIKSQLDQAKVNLSYAIIYSPIDGVVLDRSVEEGQTVAASYSTPTLFIIARDLKEMEVEADVDEADIGQVQEGQRVVFTVDTYPDDEFEGTVKEIHLNPETTSNVVTYTVIIDAPNSELKLKPGLTATITIITKEAKDIMALPVMALSFTPSEALVSNFNIDGIKTPVNGDKNQASEEVSSKTSEGMPKVWVKKGSNLVPKMIKTGITDRAFIEIIEGVAPGDSVVTFAEEIKDKKAAASGSPFMPQRPGSKKK